MRTLFPYTTLFRSHGLLGGRYDPATGEYRTPDGAPRCYVTSDRVQDDAFRALSYEQLFDAARQHDLAYDPDTATGTFYYALGGLPAFGKLGVVAIGTTTEDAQRRYDALLDLLRCTATTARIPVAAN